MVIAHKAGKIGEQGLENVGWQILQAMPNALDSHINLLFKTMLPSTALLNC